MKKRLTFPGNFCDIAMCGEVCGGSFCENGSCSQRQTWERLKAFEDIYETPEDALNAKNMLANFRKYGAEPHDYATMKAAHEAADKAKADLSYLINNLFGEDAPTKDRIIELVHASRQVGKFILWDHGSHQSIHAIQTVMLCPEGIRYDLGLIQPLTNHPGILKILSREEAETIDTTIAQGKDPFAELITT